MTVQVALSRNLEEEQAARVATAARLESSSQRVLAGPLASGLVTIADGRIGIRGAVLFQRNSSELSDEGKHLLAGLAPPLRTYLEQRGLSVMVSGFTDDLPVRESYQHSDNWELSTQRALNVTRTLVAAGSPEEWVFAAGFGSNHPIAPNDSQVEPREEPSRRDQPGAASDDDRSTTCVHRSDPVNATELRGALERVASSHLGRLESDRHRDRRRPSLARGSRARE